jgi:DNA-binding IclR family transcriptional regulator
MKSKTSGTSSAEKALKILLAFTPHNLETGTLTLSEKLNIHKSTVSRLLHILTEHGFLQQNPATKKYVLGRSAAKIGEAVMKSLNNSIVNIAIPFMIDLSNRMGESIALEVLSGTDIYLAHHIEGQNHIRFSFRSGEHVPLHVAAGAKAILAFCDPTFVNSCLKADLHNYTPNTIVSKKQLFSVLEEIRKTGIAFDKGERYEDVHAIGVPIFNHEGAPVAALVMAAPAFRLTPSYLEETAGLLKQTAEAISKQLFY